ncbi:DUF1905 domain-containing protein [Pontixanthobacter luteolus]|uniref:DUF1905 domain-containing protein n=1 Tax=Pontixanthobacter luteolus TaxID=295089 RepID=UPI002303C5C8|nr:DUF1905 domain-containing protein [Pontixanthobacter luteolus]
MSEILTCRTQMRRWQGERGTYHLVAITGEDAQAIAMHERLLRLELGARRGFGSVKVFASIGDTRWKSSVFPQSKSSEWILLVSKKVLRAEELAEGDTVMVQLELL